MSSKTKKENETDNSKTAVNLHNTIDARVWADEFNKVLVSHGEQPIDPGFLIGWFANAIMAGYDHASRICQVKS